MKNLILLIIFTFFLGSILIGQVPQSFKIGKLKYEGGGDWYANPSSLPNLFKYIKSNTKMNISLSEETVEPSSSLIFQYPMIYMTGHATETMFLTYIGKSNKDIAMELTNYF